MNILTDALPFKIGGYEVRTDFRVWLRVSAYIESVDMEKLSDLDYFAEVMDTLGELVFIDWPDFYTIDVYKGIMDFLSCREAAQINLDGIEKDNKSVESVFDINFDSGAIYASFLSQYGIDLIKIKSFHWFVFNVLLQNLGDDTPLQNRVKLRKTKATDVPKEKHGELKRVQQLYRIPISKAEQEQREALTEYLRGGQ